MRIKNPGRKRILIGVALVVIAILVTIVLPSRKQRKQKKTDVKEIYTCPMHPQIIRDEPGDCPICGMPLVKKTQEGENLDTLDLSAQVKEPNSIIISNIKTVHPKRTSNQTSIEATGYITYDQRSFNSISARYDGRIENLYVKYNFKWVKMGEKVFEIYSPDLVTAQKEYIFLLKNDSKNSDLIKNAREKLNLLGMTSTEIDVLEKKEEPDYSVLVISPYSGHIHDIKHEILKNSPDQMEMMETSNPIPSLSDFSIKEGMYVKKGEPIFNVINTHQVWAVLKVFAENAFALKPKQKVEIVINEDTANLRNGTIDFIEPLYEEGAKALNVRVYLNNHDHKIKIGDLVTAKIETGEKKSLFVPTNSVVDLGVRKIAFVKTGKNVFKAREVVTGIQIKNWIEIKEGLNEQNEIALNAQFLVDSEDFIKSSEK